ncbi:lytic murein transglycosylase [Sphingomonas sabuli]|uniref:Lytic murein transglycosylase n=1 Tax=Sphingomonas sabuli TaxID=2764186 RepID=A0A7G9L3K4_9SPHN|nr:lytic murein transglycosylase [Sphingomonas sabuli]QNM83203.1 lytic murein transglycosylase [Sphingomonas sabuli]
MRWTVGWTIAGVAALAIGPAQAENSRVLQGNPAPVKASKAAARVAETAAAAAATAAAADQAYAQPVRQAPYANAFEQYKAYLSGRARSEGIRPATIQAVIPYLTVNGRVMELDRAQMPTGRPIQSDYFPSFRPYIDKHVTGTLISRGQSRYSSHWANLSRIQQVYGVDPSVIMAIYGKETSYGSVTGNFDLLEALATLAYEGRRRKMFEDEFIAALKLLDSGVQRWQLKGSYAGATGYPQFMPSVVLRLRADGDGDGYADIWRNEDDAFASIANYLRQAGWKRGIPWGVPVNVPANLNRAAIRSPMTPPRCAAVFKRHSRWMTVAQWRALGVMPVGRGLPDTELATLMETPGAYSPGYLLTQNYRAILDYNCSNYYAMSIGLLANAIARI